MGQQVLTVAGQIVGGYFFGPVGAAVGGAIGGAIGGALFSEDTVIRGPRLGDLHIQTSSYGNAVPILKGTCRVAGNVIWSTDIRETLITTEEETGKGGPDTIKEEWQYELDCHVALCEGEVLEIERIFANGVLIFDIRTGTSAQNVFANGQWARATILYPGSETQLPDPTYEAAVGVGNASAYRGTAYVSIVGLQLNVLKTSVMPSFEFVVVQDGTPDQYIRKLAEDGISPSYRRLSGAGLWPQLRVEEGVIRVANGSNAAVELYDFDGNHLGTDTKLEIEALRPAEQIFGSEHGFWAMWDGTPANVVDSPSVFPRNLRIGIHDVYQFIDGESPERHFIGFTQFNGDRYFLGYVCDVGAATQIADQWIRFEWTGDEIVIDDTGSVDFGANVGEDFGAPSSMFNLFASSFGEGDLRSIWQGLGASNQNVRVLRIDDDGVMRLKHDWNGLGNDPMTPEAGSFSATAAYADNGLGFFVADDALFIYSRMPEIDSTGVPLSEIVADICDRAGIPSAEYDVTSLTENVEGFVIGQTMSGRAAIEALRPGYYFDAVDGDTLKFVNRGLAAVGTFEYVDLGAGEGAGQPLVVASQFAQETELPSRVNIKYISKEADYQIGAQSARRETTNSQEILNIELPVVMVDQRAAEATDVNLRDQWAGSAVRTFSTGLRYSKYEPTDVMLLDDGIVVRQIRLTRRVDRGVMIEWEGRDEDAAIYDSNAIGMSITVPEQTLGIPGPTSVEVLDLPPLTELQQGNEAAAYIAGKGFLSTWSGAVVQISRDGGATYTAGTNIDTASVMGSATTTLADFLGGNAFDEASIVRVSIGAGTLSSATHTQLLNGSNGAVIGDEILQFRTATLISTGVYDLTGFLRGRKGTEWAMSTHAAYERFVLLTTNLRNLPLQVSDRTAIDLLVRASSNGTFTSTTGHPFTTQLARLMPYSPVHLSAVRNADGSWRLTWVRRDRYMNDWNDGADVPMSEAAELYDIEIYNVGAELVETYTDVNDEYVDVDADVLGGSPTPTSINFSAYQKSAIVGRGFEANATITQAL